MYQYKDHNAFARQLTEMAIDPVVAEREYVELPSEDEYSDYLTEILEVIYEDVSGDDANEEKRGGFIHGCGQHITKMLEKQKVHQRY